MRFRTPLLLLADSTAVLLTRMCVALWSQERLSQRHASRLAQTSGKLTHAASAKPLPARLVYS